MPAGRSSNDLNRCPLTPVPFPPLRMSIAQILRASRLIRPAAAQDGQLLASSSRDSSADATVTTLVRPRPRVMLPKGPPEDLPV